MTADIDWTIRIITRKDNRRGFDCGEPALKPWINGLGLLSHKYLEKLYRISDNYLVPFRVLKLLDNSRKLLAVLKLFF
jgi:hypothetical protein